MLISLSASLYQGFHQVRSHLIALFPFCSYSEVVFLVHSRDHVKKYLSLYSLYYALRYFSAPVAAVS